MCDCPELPTLIDISNCYSDFMSGLKQLDAMNWSLLMQCPDCNQLYKTEEWDKYQTCYAVKIDYQEAWQSLDTEALIKERIVLRAGGLLPEPCLQSGCDQQQVSGRALCVHHLYLTGVHA